MTKWRDWIRQSEQLEPGIPCSHPGCTSHLSHPCEGCGRYGAGLLNGPDINAVMNRLIEISLGDPIVYNALKTARHRYWDNETVLAFLVLELQKANQQRTRQLVWLMEHTATPVALPNWWNEE